MPRQPNTKGNAPKADVTRDEGKWKLVNPLAIRFSQPRIAPHFRDGRLLADTADEMLGAVHEFGVTEEAGNPSFDFVITPPFPCCRIISWLPKLRDADGEAKRNADGDQLLGDRAWFAIDNRRLWALQHTAISKWPKRCCVVVRCLEEVPGTTMRELRKFRTTTQGRAVEVGVHDGDTLTWQWGESVAGPEIATPVEPEGLFAEDLWDADRWASEALATAQRNESNRDEPKREREPSPVVDEPKPVQEVQRTQPVVSQPKVEIVPCPVSGWQYKDPKGVIQGPFDLAMMQLWHHHGYFQPTLPMRSNPADAFRPLGELFPATAMPFQTIVIRYRE